VTSPIIRSGTLRRCEPRLYPSTKLWKGSVRSTCGSAASLSAGSVGRSRWFDHPPLLGEHLDEAVAASWRTCGGALADQSLRFVRAAFDRRSYRGGPDRGQAGADVAANRQKFAVRGGLAAELDGSAAASPTVRSSPIRLLRCWPARQIEQQHNLARSARGHLSRPSSIVGI
jgi:hypothetical protein